MNQEIRFCASRDGTRIAYARGGNGPPLVKTANWMNHLEYDWRSPVWQPWLEALFRAHTLYRYDKRGCGLSDRTVADLSFDAWVHDLEAVVDAAGLRRFPLFGMSQGGPIAIAYAARYPERVSHLILYGSYVRGRLRRNLSPEQLEETETLHKLIKVGWGHDSPAFRQVFTTLFIPEGTPEQIQWFNELQRVSTSPETALRIVQELDSLDVRELAGALSVPTLVLHSRGDMRIPFEEGRLAAASIPGARFVPLESKNHVLLSSEPAWSQLFEEIERFLNGDAGDQARLAAPKSPSGGVEKTYWALTDREREVLALLARGDRNEEIARKLVLSPKTVRNYVSNILDKLGVASRGEAIVLAHDAGFVERRSDR